MNSNSKTKSHSERSAKNLAPIQGDDGWSELSNILNSRLEKSQITLVVGAGIHQVPKHTDPCTYESSLLLSSWDRIIANTFPNIKKSDCPSLSWELGLQVKAAKEPAFKRQLLEFDRVRKAINIAELNVLKSQDLYHPISRVLRSTHVSDVISLNFDLVAEAIISNSIVKKKNFKRKTSENDRYWQFPGTRVWHPHGDRLLGGSECIGIRQYGLNIKHVELARQEYKRTERFQLRNKSKRSRSAPSRWVNLFMTNHLIFVGCSLKFSEWDIWFALVNRWRNYANPKNKRYEPKTFVLTTGAEHKHLPSQFLRLGAPNYDQGWDWLGKLLNQAPNVRVRKSP